MKKRILAAAAVGLILAGSVQVMAAGTQQPVTVKGDEVTYNSKTGETVITGRVVISQNEETISGDQAVYNLKSGNGEITGNVIADKGELGMRAAVLTIANRGDDMIASGGAVLTKGADRLSAPTVSYWKQDGRALTSGGRARLESADALLEADIIEAFTQESRAVGTGNIYLRSDSRNLEATADRADYQGATEGKRSEAVLSGNARAVQDGNVLTGNRLVMSLDDRVSDADGNAKLVITPKPAAPKEEKQ